ncbi:MAG: hypothetical protein RR487_06625 [Acinetobacter sp.]
MKLIELAKKNLQEYISVKETLELISTTQQTPLSYVATFLISQSFETNIPTYDADKYYSIHSNDDWNWGVFQYTNSILSNLADNEIYKDAFTFSGNDLPENLENTYWKRKELYNLELIKNLSLDFYFRVQDIKIIAQYTSFDSKEFESKELFSDSDVKKLLKNGISSYMLGSAEKYNLIDDFVLSSLGFFECNFDKGFEIKRDDLKKLFFDNQIIIKGFNDFSPKSSQSNNNIWDANYLNLQLNDSPDSVTIDIDFSFYELADLHFESEQNHPESKEFPLFYLNDTLTVIEASCIISGDNPAEILEIQDNPTLLASYKKFKNAKSLIESAINLRTLIEYTNIGIATHEFKTFLASKKISIDGFNDSLDKKDCIEELTEQIQRQLIYISQIENEVNFYHGISYQNLDDENFDKLLDAQDDELFKLKAEKGALEQRNLFLKQKIEKSQLEIEKLNTLLENYPQSVGEVLKNLENITSEQEIPNSRKRNNVLKILSILSQMADLPPEPFTAFNVLEAFAIQNNKDIPSKHTVADWLKRARDSN